MQRAPDGWSRVVRRSIASDAREQITRLIVTGQLKPGERLPPERELIAMLGVSRPTLREGIAALVAMGILEARQGAGTFVSTLDPARIVEPLLLIVSLNGDVLHELFAVRRILESGAIQLAASRITDEEIDELRRIVRDAHDAHGDAERFITHDADFHRAIHRVAGNGLLSALLESVARLAWDSRMLTSQRLETRRVAAHDHERILEALEARDPHAAREAMLRHLDNMRAALDTASIPGEG